MDVRTISLPANVAVRQIIPFRFFMLVATQAALDVKFVTPNGLGLIGEVGRAVEAGYKKFPLNPLDESERWGGYELLSTSLQTVTVACSDSAGDYARIAQLFELEGGSTLVSTADVTLSTAAVTPLVPANATRKCVHVKNNSANTQAVRIGDSSITAGRGLELDPGVGHTLKTKGAVSAIRTSGSSSPVISILEET